MMRNRILLPTVLFLFLLPNYSVHAFQITSYDVSISLTPDDGVHERIAIGILNTEAFPLEEFSYSFGTDVKNLRVYDEEGDLITVVKKGESATSFREPLLPDASHKVSIEFDTTGYITTYPEFKEFSMVLHLPPNTQSFSMRLTLPEGAILLKPLREPLTTSDVVPLPDDVYSDGRSIIFEWRKTGVEDFSVYVKYVTKEAGFEVPRSLILVLAILLLASSLYLWRRRGVEKIEYMKEDEQLVIREIVQNEGIDQREIQKKTDFSKAKVSKIVSELENRGIVRKERIGRRNKLYLTKEFKKS
ncbi:MAG: helix-turn-helix transcriptional regulator [Candidatus Hydrothermarchaeaceae archaeon]